MINANKIKKGLKNPHRIIPHIWKNRSGLSYKFGKNGKSFLPPIVKLYVNTICNCSCFFCDIGQKNSDSSFYKLLNGSSNEDLSMETLDKLIAQFGNHKPDIIISGMEPLLHPKIIEIITLLKQNKFTIYLNTNGVLLPKLGKGLMLIGIKKIMVSIDGPEEIHNHIRGEGVYQKAISGLKILQETKAKYELNTVVNATSCITKYNYKYIKESSSFLFDNNLVDTVSFVSQYFVTPEASEHHNQEFSSLGKSTVANHNPDGLEQFDGEVVSTQIKYLKETYHKKVYGGNKLLSPEYINTYFNKPDTKIGNKMCKVPWNRATILSNGDCIVHNRCIQYPIGNIHSTPFKQLWNGDRYKYFRKQLMKHKQFPVCIRCCGVK